MKVPIKCCGSVENGASFRITSYTAVSYFLFFFPAPMLRRKPGGTGVRAARPSSGERASASGRDVCVARSVQAVTHGLLRLFR